MTFKFVKFLDHFEGTFSGGGCQLPLGIRARIQGGDLCCEAIFFDGSDKPRFGTVSGAFHTPREAASALLDKICETAVKAFAF